MNKQDFLNELNQRLELLDPKERRELLSDYQEHFRNGIEAGKSEEQIVFDLGKPEEIAADIISERAFVKSLLKRIIIMYREKIKMKIDQ